MTKLITVTSEYEELTRLHEERKALEELKLKYQGVDAATLDQISNSLDDLKKAFSVSSELDDFFSLKDTSETDEKIILYERERVEVFYNIVMDYLHSAYNSIDNAAIDLMAASKVRETKE